jgi:hypothetical protein
VGKLTALALAPALALHLWHTQRWRGLIVASLAAAALVAVAYLPFWAGAATLQPLLHQTGRLVWSPGSLLILASELLPGGPYPLFVRLLLGCVWLAACTALLRRARPDASPAVLGGPALLGVPALLAAATARQLLVSVLLLTSAVFGHYFVPAVALAAVAADRRLERLVMCLSLGGLAAYGVEVLGLALGPAWNGSPGYQLSGSLVLLGPAAIVELSARVKDMRTIRWPLALTDRSRVSASPQPLG